MAVEKGLGKLTIEETPELRGVFEAAWRKLPHAISKTTKGKTCQEPLGQDARVAAEYRVEISACAGGGQEDRNIQERTDTGSTAWPKRKVHQV